MKQLHNAQKKLLKFVCFENYVTSKVYPQQNNTFVVEPPKNAKYIIDFGSKHQFYCYVFMAYPWNKIFLPLIELATKNFQPLEP